MSEVIFERIAPVVTVHDVDADLGRYRQLGFATELDQPAGYGFAERGAVQLHLQSDDPNDPGGRGASCTSPMSMPCTPSGRQQVSKVGSWGRTTPRTVSGNLSTSTPTASFIESARHGTAEAQNNCKRGSVVVPEEVNIFGRATSANRERVRRPAPTCTASSSSKIAFEPVDRVHHGIAQGMRVIHADDRSERVAVRAPSPDNFSGGASGTGDGRHHRRGQRG